MTTDLRFFSVFTVDWIRQVVSQVRDICTESRDEYKKLYDYVTGNDRRFYDPFF